MFSVRSFRAGMSWCGATGLFIAISMLSAGFGTAKGPPVTTTLPASSPSPDASLDGVLGNIRRAIGYEQLKKHQGGIVVKSTFDASGAKAKLRLLFAPDGRFVESVKREYTTSVGYDGTTGWQIDWSDTPHVYEPTDESFKRTKLATWLRTGCWLDEQCHVQLSIVNERTDKRCVVLSAKLDGQAEYWLVVDRSTWLPKAICDPECVNVPTWRPDDYRDTLGFLYPHRIIAGKEEKARTTIVVESVEEIPHAERDPYALSANVVDDTRFSQDMAPDVEMKLAETSGHALVRPLIDGEDAHWFVLDSGCNLLFMDPDVADKLDLPVVVEAEGEVGQSRTHVPLRRSKELKLGPIAISNLMWFQADMDVFSSLAGTEVAGIIGYDLFCRAVVEFDILNASLKIHDPGTYRSEGVDWLDFRYDNQLICVPCKFEGDREALFLIDTGSNQGIEFYAPAVEKFNLVDGSKNRGPWEKRIPNSLFSKQKSDVGSVAWFEIGGHRIENPRVTFARPGPDDEPYNSQRRAGHVGLGLLAKFKVIFDYPHKQIAFVKLPDEDRK